jgi:hypothetical protein
MAEISDDVENLLASVAKAGKPGDDLLPVSARLRMVKLMGSDPSSLIGQMIEGQGIFLGRYAPVDRDGNDLGKIFNVFAAPKDLKGGKNSFNKEGCFQYDELLECLSALKGWEGFDGTNFANDTELLEALRNDSYNGGWIVPPIELLGGKNFEDTDVQPDSFVAHKDKGHLKALRWIYRDEDPTNWYASCTETKETADCVKLFGIAAGKGGFVPKWIGMSRCRPVRLVPVGGPA